MALTTQEFAQKIKQKFPEYKNANDDQLVKKILEKYPVYKSRLMDYKEEQPVNTTQITPTEQKENKPGLLERVDEGLGKVFKPVSNFLFGSASKTIANTVGQGIEAAQGKKGVFTEGFNQQFGDIDKALQGQGGSNLKGTAKNIAGLALDSTIAGVGEKTMAKVAGKISAPLIARAEKLYQSALKPTASVLKKSPDVVKTGIKEGIKVSDSGLSKVRGIMDDIGEDIGRVIDNGIAQGRAVQKKSLLPYLDQLKEYLGNSLGGKQLVKEVDDISKKILNDLPDNIPIETAQKIKQTTQGLVNKYYGAMAPVEQETKKQLARGLKDEIAKAVPEIAELNARDAKLFQLEESLQRAVSRMGNREVINAFDIMTSLGGAMVNPASPVKAAGGVLFLKKFLQSPAVKSQSAIWLNKLAENGEKLLKAGRYPAAITASKILQLFNDEDSSQKDEAGRR